MTDYDDRLRDALSEEDEDFIRNLRTESGLFVQITETFRGPLKWVTWIVNILVLIASGIGIWAAVEFLTADTTQAMLRWAGLAWAAWTIQVALKQWIWDRVNTLSILRELKRIELRVTRMESV